MLLRCYDMSWTKAIESLEPVGDAKADQVGANLCDPFYITFPKHLKEYFEAPPMDRGRLG